MCCADPASGRTEPIWLGVMWGWDMCAGRAKGCAATRAVDGTCTLWVMLGTEMRGVDTWGITTRGAIRGAEKCGAERRGAKLGREKCGVEKCGAANARIPPPKCPPPPGRAAAGVVAQAMPMSRTDVMRTVDCVMEPNFDAPCCTLKVARADCWCKSQFCAKRMLVMRHRKSKLAPESTPAK